MGFDVERKSRSPELWELGDDSAADALVTEEQYKKKSKQSSVLKEGAEPIREKKTSSIREKKTSSIREEKESSIHEGKTSSIHAGYAAPDAETSGASTRKKNGLFIMMMVLVVIVFTVCILQFGRIISSFMHEKDNMENSTPISRSMRESLIGEMVPLPSGMEFGRYEMQGSALTIYVKGKNETASSDYIISASFALRLMEEANSIRFVEEDTGREYLFNR